LARGEPHWIDRRVDDELTLAADFSGFFEEAKGKPGRDAERDVTIEPAPRWRATVGGDLRGPGAHLEEEAALVRGLSQAKVFDLDRIGRKSLLLIVDLDLHEVGSTDLRPLGKAPRYSHVAQAAVAQHPGDDDERKEHPEQDIQEVVGREDADEAHPKGDRDEVLAFAG